MKTPGGPSARTMDVVNGATDILNEINKLRLPVPQWDWSPEIEWWPGDPIGPEPVIEYSYVNAEGVSIDVLGIPNTEEGGGQCIRPMIEEYDLDEDFSQDTIHMDCDECEVSGAPMATSCWFCGKSLPGLWRPSRDNWFDPDYSYVEGPEGYVYQGPIIYSVGDEIEDFDPALWERANTFKEEMAAASWRAFSEPLQLFPWQERIMQEYAKADVEATQRMMSGGNIDNQGRVSLWTLFPRRNAGRQYLEQMVASLFKEEELTVISAKTYPVPTNVQIQESRRRPVQVQNTYPTSSNPTQERRRRNL